jgi:hypothetical protein
MPHVVLSDNDALIKIAALDLIDAALKALGVSSAKEVFVLPTFKRMVQKNHAYIATRAGRDGFNRLVKFVQVARVIDKKPDPADEFAMEGVESIDSGEVMLFAACRNYPESLVLTGDKRAIRAVSEHAACGPIRKLLAGKVVCVEQLVRRILDGGGFDAVRDAVQANQWCDGRLTRIFNHGCTRAACISGLEVAIGELRLCTPAILVAN